MTVHVQQGETAPSSETEESFRLLVDSVIDYAIFMLDPTGHVVTWNAGAERIKGYRREEIIGRHMSAFYPAEDLALEKPRRELEIAAREGRYIEEGWRLRKDGERFRAHVTITALRDSTGRLRGFAKVTREVTEIRQAAEALRQSELRMTLMVDAVRDYGIFMLDPDGQVSTWNAGAERISGYRADEIIGRHFSIFYTEADRARGQPERELRVALTEGRYEEEGWLLRKDGRRFFANVVLTPVFDEEGRHLGFAKVTRDTTERRVAEEELHRSDERFRLIVESVRDYAIFMLDASGHVSSWNPGAQRLKGYTEQEILGQHFSVFYDAEQRQRGHPEEVLQRALTDGSFSEEGWRVRKDGSPFWASVVITPLRDPHGRHIGYAKVTRDVTDRRLAEERLRQLNEELETRIQLRTADLVAANEELEAFSYSVSHDLRAPLRALDGFSRLLLDQASDKLTAQEQDYLQRIRVAAQRMSTLTDAMLMLSRLTRVAIHPQEVDLSALCEEIVAELRQSEPERAVEVAVAPNLRATVDARLIRVVFENLLRNAWKFTRKQAHARVEIDSFSHEDASGFLVRDNGVGFDPRLSAKLFLPFARLHRAKDFEGSGIGLATVCRILARHGGRIWAESSPGAGATFYFTLGARDGD